MADFRLVDIKDHTFVDIVEDRSGVLVKQLVMFPFVHILGRLQDDLHSFVHKLLNIFKAWFQKDLRNLQNYVCVEERLPDGRFGSDTCLVLLVSVIERNV